MFCNPLKFLKSLKKPSDPANQNDNQRHGISRRFSEDRRGNIGIMFALALLPVLATVGAAVDYSNVLRIKSQMQAALDAATLAGGRELQVSGDANAAWTTAENFFNSAVASLPAGSFRTNGNGGTQTPHLTTDQATAVDVTNNTVNLTAAAVYQPFILPIIGINELPINVRVDGELLQGTSGNNGYQNLELVMMLDTTGSMSGSKMAALKTAAKDLIQIVIGNGNQTQYTSKIALAPFSNSVNVGSYVNVVTGYASLASLVPGLGEIPAAPAAIEFAEVTPRFNTVASHFSKPRTSSRL